MTADARGGEPEPIAFLERTDGQRLIRFTIDGAGEAMVTIETDTGPLRQLVKRCSASDLDWIAATAADLARTLDRLAARTKRPSMTTHSGGM